MWMGGGVGVSVFECIHISSIFVSNTEEELDSLTFDFSIDMSKVDWSNELFLFSYGYKMLGLLKE